MMYNDTKAKEDSSSYESELKAARLEQLMMCMPLMGPNFDPERDIEDFSDDSSSDEEEKEDSAGIQAAEAEDEENLSLDQLMDRITVESSPQVD